jgi:glycosyltransferase involved in cell wall biosynthesis
VALQRNVGGKAAKGKVIVFLDADVRVSARDVSLMVDEFSNRKLDGACPWYWPMNSKWYVKLVYGIFGILFWVSQWFMASGAGSCVVVRKDVFKSLGGFDAKTTFDDIELIRRLSIKFRFRMLNKKILVSDRRFRKYGFWPTLWLYARLSFWFMLSDFEGANRVGYEFDGYGRGEKG